MTNLITLTIPNDDHIALRAFGKALEEMALAHGAPLQLKINEEALSKALGELQQAAPRMMQELRFDGEELQGKRKEPEIDTTAQQVESLVTNVVNREVHFDNPAPQVSDASIDKTGTPWDERIHSASKALNADGTWRLRRKPKDMDEAEWAKYVEAVKTNTTDVNDDSWNTDRRPGSGGEGGVGVGESDDFEQPALFTPENYVHMYRAIDNIYALAKSDVEVTEFEADGYVRHTQEQYDAWEGPNTVDEGDDHHIDAGVVTEQTVAGIPPLPVPPPVVIAPPVPEVTTWDFPRLMTFLTERHGKIDVATVNTLLAQDDMLSVQELNAHPDKIGPFVARVKAHLGE